MSKQDPVVREVGYQIGGYMERIAKLFKPGVKLTMVARRPETPDGSQDMVLTDDDLDRVIAALEIRKAEESPQRSPV